MPLSWNEIKSRALAFSREWQHETSEDAEAKSFWDGFFNIFGISRKRIAAFEEPVKKLGDKQGFIDLFWKGVLLVEHKSRGKNLDKAYTQALDYFPGILERDLPKYVLVSDFARFRLYDLEPPSPSGRGDGGEGAFHEFELQDLHKNVRLFGFIAGYQTHKIQEQDPVNIKAAERMGKLHDQMRETGFEGHPLELYLVRLLFCLFGEDTGIFERQQLQDYVEQRTGSDGSDLAYHLSALFQVLNTPEQKRLNNLDEQLCAFPYVNGKLFEETLPMASFDSKMRQSLLDCCALDWSRISPAIFGSLFQSIMDKQARRNLGAHYTSEKNILKLIKPLFLDALWVEFNKAKSNKNRLFEFHKKLRSLTFFDPACGCGNFLVIAYRELRLLELEVLRASRASEQLTLDVHSLINLDVDQFYGIEIEEFPAQIAQVAMWLMDHQMNLRVSEEFGMYFARIPLKASANIVCGNALRLDWNEVVAAEKCSYVMGNPPFIGKKEQSAAQKSDMALVMHGVAGAGVLDFVAAWYVKAARYIKLPSPSGRGAGGEGDVRSERRHHVKLPLPPEHLEFTRTLRTQQTDAENLVWSLLRNRRLGGAKFRRQHPLPPYVLDFYCHEARLAIELDGGQHLESERDTQRDAWLERHGIRVLRYWNNDVLAQTESVLEDIWRALQDAGVIVDIPSPPAPLPAGEGSPIRCAFVSTNSITQGEQVGALWGWLLAQGVKIHFAHRTFSWSNEARGKAAVHCVIVGFGLGEVDEKTIFEYEDVKGEALVVKASNINPYLVDAPDVALENRKQPILDVPCMNYGSMPIDDGHLILSVAERGLFLQESADNAPLIRRYMGGDEFINNTVRYCLWLPNANPAQLRQSRLIGDRIGAVMQFRSSSGREATQKLAATPSLFGEIRQPDTPYLLLPKVSSEKRYYMPVGFIAPSIIANGSALIVPNAELLHFGILQSSMHMAWMRQVCGRMKSDYQYSASIVYNNFPWPDFPSFPALLPAGGIPHPNPLPAGEGAMVKGDCFDRSKSPSPSGRGVGVRERVEIAAQAVLDARAQFPESTLADLYDPLTMPPALLKAHQSLDKAVDTAYGKTGFKSEAERVAFLFERYQQLTSLLPTSGKSGKTRKEKK
jgi:very-short-patch-repair endonuclease